MTKEVLEKVRQVAVEFYEETGRILPHPTGEIAEFEAAEKMGLTLASEGKAGHDATRPNGE